MLQSSNELQQHFNKLLGYDVMEHMKRPWGLRNPSKNMEWHHPVDDYESLELLRKQDHRNPDLQELLHKGNRGGYSQRKYLLTIGTHENSNDKEAYT